MKNMGGVLFLCIEKFTIVHKNLKRVKCNFEHQAQLGCGIP